MNKKNFKVIEIVDATTIRVVPEWRFRKPDGSLIDGDLIKITGLNPGCYSDDVKILLGRLLQGEDIDAYCPAVVDNSLAPIECRIFVCDKDVVYFFPGLKHA